MASEIPAPTAPLEQEAQTTPANVVDPQEEGLDVNDFDSAHGDDIGSITTSLKSSLWKYEYENGRTYCGYGREKYFIPHDDDESDRLDLMAHMLNLVMSGKLHKAPIGEDPHRILDLGTGTGIWAIDMADQYPSAEVIGNDIANTQPNLVPPNLRFEIDDIEEDWVYSRSFDFIHMRILGGAIRNWPRLLEQSFKFTKPGGWVECMDYVMGFYTISGDYKAGCATDRWCGEVRDLLGSLGLEPNPGPKLLEWVKDAGFINVRQEKFVLPVGTWPKDPKMKEIGLVNQLQILDGLEGFTLRPLTMKGWTPQEIQVFIAQVRKEMLDTKMRMQTDIYLVYGQKPFDAPDLD